MQCKLSLTYWVEHASREDKVKLDVEHNWADDLDILEDIHKGRYRPSKFNNNTWWVVTHIGIEVRLNRGCFIEYGEELPGKPADELSQKQNAQHLDHL